MTANPIRLALRAEGDFWNAYLAPRGSMDGAVFLGSLHMRLAQDPKLKRAFMALMQDATKRLLRQTGAKITRWDEPIPAPESERGQA